jgi:deoxycytidine triphosphate deaminase
MLLSDDAIKAKGLILKDSDSHYRAASYDVGIGTILTVDGKEVSELRLEPQGIVEVISSEEVKVPHNVVGYAMVKTSLCNKGILPLNIGIVDPGYEGPVSATLLNFGKQAHLLTTGEVFLRLTFHECYRSRKERPINRVSYEEYVKDRKKKVVNFADTFLNLDATIKKSMEPFRASLRNNALIWVPVFAILFTALAFAVTLGVNYTNRGFWSKEDVKAEIREELGLTKEGGLDSRVKTLESEIKTLRASKPQMSPTP